MCMCVSQCCIFYHTNYWCGFCCCFSTTQTGLCWAFVFIHSQNLLLWLLFCCCYFTTQYWCFFIYLCIEVISIVSQGITGYLFC